MKSTFGTLSVRGAVRRLFSVLVLACICVILLACQSYIEIVQPLTLPATPVMSVVTVAPSEHAVGVIGVDFDPPLDYEQVISNGGVTLLVAVKNLGLSTEPDVAVRAQLFDPAEYGEYGEPINLLDQTLLARSLAPGEVRVVRFDQVTDLPLHKQYRLVVDVAPVPGERDLSDNTRSYDILIHGMQ